MWKNTYHQGIMEAELEEIVGILILKPSPKVTTQDVQGMDHARYRLHRKSVVWGTCYFMQGQMMVNINSASG